MSLIAFMPLVAGVAFVALAIALGLAGRHSPVNRALAAFCVCSALWNLSQLILAEDVPGLLGSLSLKVFQAAFILTPAALTHFCFEAVHDPKPKLITWFYGVYSAVALAGFSGSYFSVMVPTMGTLAHPAYGFSVTTGSAIAVLPWLLLVPAGAVTMLWLGRKEYGPATRLLPGFSLLIILMMRDSLAVGGNAPGTGHVSMFTPWSAYASTVVCLSLFVGVLYGDWFELGLRRYSLAWGGFNWFFYFWLGETFLTLSRTWMGMGWTSSTGPEIFLAAGAATLALCTSIWSAQYTQLHNREAKPADLHTPSSVDQAKPIQGLLQAAEPSELKESLGTMLVDNFRARRYHLLLRDETARVFTPFDFYPPNLRQEPKPLRMDSPIVACFLQEKPDYLHLGASDPEKPNSELSAAAHAELRAWDAEWCFPLYSGTELYGVLSLSRQTSATAFTPAEIEILLSTARTLGVITHRLALSGELELIGRMSRGMAHDLSDLITPLRTLVQLLQENNSQTRMKELVPVAQRNLEAIQSYVDEALFFSRNRTPRIRPARLDQILQKVVQLAEPKSRKKGLRVVLAPMAGYNVEVDDVLIQRMVANILSNAMDASEPSSQIEIELQQIHREADRPPWTRIRVMDWGSGISEENLQKVMRGRFTTKAKNQDSRGFGLGLSIARKIAQLHDGHLTIYSEEGVGTCVEVDLPARPSMHEGTRGGLPAMTAGEELPPQKEYR